MSTTTAQPATTPISYSGYKQQQGEQVIAITANNGYVFAPVPVAPVHATDTLWCPEGLKALKQVAQEVGLDLRGAYINLDGGFDSARNRQCMCKAGLIPHIQEPPGTASTPSADATASCMPPSMCCAGESSGRLRGQTSASDYCSALNASSSDTRG
jgi:hypothetical protein